MILTLVLARRHIPKLVLISGHHTEFVLGHGSAVRVGLHPGALARTSRRPSLAGAPLAPARLRAASAAQWLRLEVVGLVGLVLRLATCCASGGRCLLLAPLRRSVLHLDDHIARGRLEPERASKETLVLDYHQQGGQIQRVVLDVGLLSFSAIGILRDKTDLLPWRSTLNAIEQRTH